MNRWKNIGQLLLEFGLINEDDLKEGLDYQNETGLRLGEALVKLRRVSVEDINWVLSKQLDIPFVTVEDIIPDDGLFGKFKKEFLLINRMLPLHETDEQISVVAEDPLNETAIDVIESNLNKKVSISTGSGKKIYELLKNYYKKSIYPELILSIEDITKRIKDTSFYRIDFLMDEDSCSISIFGCGLLKTVQKIYGTFSPQDIFSVFENMNMSFLYKQSAGNNGILLEVYPLVNKLQVKRLPAVLGRFGLHLPEEVTFSDVQSFGLPGFFNSSSPVHGYGFYSIRQNSVFEKALYLIDSAPEDFKEHYVNVCIPKTCRSCNGAGCVTCKDLGYEFRGIEGVYSSDDLEKELKKLGSAEA
jgi:type IV pilus assembly protein PilB